MASPLTGGILTAQRAQNRWKTYHLAISQPNTIFTARINQTFAKINGVNQVHYDGGTGTYGDVKPGMACWIGSTAGASDVGIVRVRKALTSIIAYFGRVSDVAFADNLYLTFVDDFPIQNRRPQNTAASVLMDQDIVFGSVTAFAPLVKIGPPAIVLISADEDDNVSHTYAAPVVYSPVGAAVDSYLWTAPGAIATSDLDTDTPTITYATMPGEYYISCTVTDENGVSTTAYRKVFVNPSDAVISPPDISGDIDSGGWSCQIEGYSGVSLSSLRDGAMCVLWKKDYVSTAQVDSYGPYAGYENIRLIGWLDGESLTINPDFGTASFTIQGPAFWLDKISGAPMNTSSVSVVPSAWSQVPTMDADKVLYRLLHWQTTITSITDITLTGSTTPTKSANINGGSIRAQVDGVAGEKLLARLCFDRFGCGRISVPQSLKDSTAKAALTVLWDCASSDWIDQISIDRITTQQTSMIELGGSSYNGTTETLIYSRAPGNVPGAYGTTEAPYTTIAVENQAEMNRLSGDLLAQRNSEYPTVDVTLYWSNDFIDFADYIVRLSVAAGDTPRGITWTNKRFVPQAISYRFDSSTGAESTAITFAEETTGTPGVFYMPPQPSDTDDWPPPGSDFPEFPPITPPPSKWFPPTIPPPPPAGECGDDAEENAFSVSFDKPEITGIDTVLSAYAYFPCKIRAASATNSTYLEISIEYGGDALEKVNVYAMDASQNRILTGVVTPPGEGGNWYTTTHVEFSPVGETDVAGFEVELEAGGGIGSAVPGDILDTGTVAGNNGSGVNVAVTEGEWYAIEGAGGPWTYHASILTPGYNFGGGNPSAGVGRSPEDLLMHLDVPSGCVLTERFSANYARTYFQGDSGEVFNFRVSDFLFLDNGGSLDYVLREATVKGARIIYLSGAGVFNVCKAD